MYKGQSITVIIPCLNEERGVGKVLHAMPPFVDEIIVVDNGSTDATAQVAASLGAKVITEELRGYGRAYRRGFAAARGLTEERGVGKVLHAMPPFVDEIIAVDNGSTDATAQDDLI